MKHLTRPQTDPPVALFGCRQWCLRRKMRGMLCLAFMVQATWVARGAAKLTVLSSVSLVADAYNDGDSFAVDVDGKRYRLRLYFVDCAETSVGSQSDARRVLEQRRYFGIDEAKRVMFYGTKAKQLTAELLARPFVVHTTFANAMGRSAGGRVYAFVVTSDGLDLATELVRRGLARARGTGRETPAGVPRDEMKERLRDLELAAALRGAGIWSESNPDRIAEFRADQRREESELQQLQDTIKDTSLPTERLDLNRCSLAALESVPGIGPVTAARIVEGRPFRSVEELVKVKGISAGRLAKLRPFVIIDGK